MAKEGNGAWKLWLKIVISVVAISIVFFNIDWVEVRFLFSELNYAWLLAAILLFAVSKVFSAIRLTIFFKAIGIKIGQLYNLQLAWLGMFYNLFLPGGIGGDAYKVYLLNKQYEVKTKLIGAAVLLDRINGVVALALLAGIGFLFIEVSVLPNWVWWVVLVLTMLAYPVYIMGVRFFFKSFQKSYFYTSFLSVCTQGSQVVSAYFLLNSLNIQSSILEYLVLFLVSSIVAVLPFTIGGIGARELTFVMGNDVLGIDQNSAVAFSLLFFLVTLFVSAFGGFVSSKRQSED